VGEVPVGSHVNTLTQSYTWYLTWKPFAQLASCLPVGNSLVSCAAMNFFFSLPPPSLRLKLQQQQTPCRFPLLTTFLIRLAITTAVSS
jgi:hypothetical protein